VVLASSPMCSCLLYIKGMQEFKSEGLQLEMEIPSRGNDFRWLVYS